MKFIFQNVESADYKPGLLTKFAVPYLNGLKFGIGDLQELFNMKMYFT